MTPSTETFVTPKALTRRLPDFFIVGHPKSGTTALYEMLRRHTQVFMPEIKETRFFSREHPYPGNRGPYPDTLEQYAALFAAARPEQRVGEASPQYLSSRVAARRIAEVQPAARIIAIIREPASFLRSFHLELLQNHVETERSFRRALALEKRRREARTNNNSPGLLYSEHVRYVEQLRRYHDAFSPGQVLVLIYEDFRRDNLAVVRQVLRFLEVDDESPIELMEANPTVRVRSARIYGLMRSVYLGRGRAPRVAKTVIKSLAPRQLRWKLLKATRRRFLYAKPATPDEQLMLELRRRFKGEVQALSDYLGRDLITLWGYDDID